METRINSLSLTRKLISFETINPPGQERACAQYLGKLLEDGGFKVAYYEFDKGRTSLIARREGSGNKAPLFFNGHMDTIPLGASAWDKDPFRGEVEGNKVHGRGSSDMKSGIAAMVVACLGLAKMPKGKAGLALVLTAYEETGSQGAYHLAQLGNVLGAYN